MCVRGGEGERGGSGSKNIAPPVDNKQIADTRVSFYQGGWLSRDVATRAPNRGKNRRGEAVSNRNRIKF